MPTADELDLVMISTPAEGVLALRLNRPRKANSLSKDLVVHLCGQLRAAASDNAVRCVVLAGSDRIFSAGADISGMVSRGVDWYVDPERLARWRDIQNFPKPIIAAVNGPAIGGGCELAMLCDIIIAGEHAAFSQGEINIGVLPGDGGTQRLPRAVGKSLAMQMILTGQSVSARRACEAGLVSEVVPDPDVFARAVEIAVQIAAHATLSVQLAKKAVLAAYEVPLSTGLAFERDRVVDAFKTRDLAEGMQAFLEKRLPHYVGE
ncbi:MAG TPA: enoyl-CoA hydratase-related protein [Castellaniella sp.]|uniref:enoyl-CoA hydratase-related protein n=1 Tax=Castellaniella sp. TaxID=1955812 RepID=UPI002F1B124F